MNYSRKVVFHIIMIVVIVLDSKNVIILTLFLVQ